MKISRAAVLGITVISLSVLGMQTVEAKTIIRFAGRAIKGGTSYDFYDKAMKEYKRLHPDVDFVYIGEVGHNEYRDKLLTLWASGQAPDVVRLYDSWIKEFAERGLLANFPTNVVNRVNSRFYASVATNMTYKGKTYGFGDENQNQAVSYSKKIFAQSGVASVPDDWNDLMALAVKLSVPKTTGTGYKQWGFCTELAQWCFTGFFRSVMESRGGTFSKGASLLFDSKEGLSAIKDISEWFGVRKFASGSPWDNAMGGSIAMTVSYPFYTIWSPKFSTRMDEVFGVAPMPKGPAGRFGHHYNWGICVNSSSKVKSAAMDFAEFMASYSNASVLDGMTYADAAVSDVSLPSVKADIKRGPYVKTGNKDWFNGFGDALEITKPIQSTEPYSSKAEEIIWEMLGPAVQGKVSPEVALANAKRKLGPIVKRFYK